MRAVRVLRFGEPEDLAITEVPIAAPGPGEVLIEVHACGVNFPDLLVARGEYQILAPLPFSPGKEVAGIVRAVGEGVSSLAPGQRVAAQMENGGYVEQVVVRAATVYPLPEGMDFAIGATLGLTYLTAHFRARRARSISRGRVGAGDGRLRRRRERRGAARESARWPRAGRGRNAGEGELRACAGRGRGDRPVAKGAAGCAAGGGTTLTGGHGVDVVVENIGGEVFDACLRALAWSGRIVVVGFVGGAFPTIRANYLLIKNISASGLHWSDYRERDPAWVRRVQDALYGLWREGKLKPAVAAVYPLEQAPAALRRMAQRGIQGKLVLATRVGVASGLSLTASD